MRKKLPKITEEENEMLEKMPLNLTGESIPVDCEVSVPNVAKWIYDSLMSEPHNWLDYDDYTIKHLRTNIEVWIANGWMYVSIYRPQRITFNIYWKLKIWKAYKTRWRRLVVRDIEAQ